MFVYSFISEHLKKKMHFLMDASVKNASYYRRADINLIYCILCRIRYFYKQFIIDVYQVQRAMQLYKSAFHPDTGELQNVFGRMSFQVIKVFFLFVYPAIHIFVPNSLYIYMSLSKLRKSTDVEAVIFTWRKVLYQFISLRETGKKDK